MKIDIKTYTLKINSFVRNGFLQLFSANVLNKLFSMVSNMIVTRLLTKADFGVLSYVLNIYAYFGLISGFGLNNGALQFGTENRNNEKEYAIFSYTLQKGVLINIGLTLVGYIGLLFVTLPFKDAKTLLIAYMPMLILEYIASVLLIILRAENRIKEYARLVNVNTVMILSGTCIGAFWGTTGVIIGKYICEIITICIIIFCMKGDLKKLKTQIDVIKDQIQDLWKYSVATGISSFLNCLLYLLDVSMIAALLKSDVMVASYKVATMIPNALQFVPSSFIICILPNIIANNNDKKWLQKHIKGYFVGIGVINFSIAIICIFLGNIIIRIISGYQYSDAAEPFRILVLGYAISGTFRSMSTNILAALRKVKFNIIISVVSGVLDVIFNYFLITNFRMNGAAYATLSTEIAASLIAFSVLLYTITNYDRVKSV